jgi:hypothetical protein
VGDIGAANYHDKERVMGDGDSVDEQWDVA